MIQRRLAIAAACLLLTAFSGASLLANVPPPEPRDFPVEPEPLQISKPADLVVRIDRRQATQIIIPQELIDQAIGKPAAKDTSSISPTRNVVAGVALSLAMVGAFLVVRRGGRKTKVVAASLLCCAALATVSTAVADLLPPGGGPRPPRASPRPPIDQPLPPDERPRVELQKPQVTVQVEKHGDTVTIVLGKDFPVIEGGRNNNTGQNIAPQE